MNRKPSAERLLSFLFLLITLGVVLYIGFSGNDLEALGEALRTMSPAYLFLCLLSWILYVLTDALCYPSFSAYAGMSHPAVAESARRHDGHLLQQRHPGRHRGPAAWRCTAFTSTASASG